MCSVSRDAPGCMQREASGVMCGGECRRRFEKLEKTRGGCLFLKHSVSLPEQQAKELAHTISMIRQGRECDHRTVSVFVVSEPESRKTSTMTMMTSTKREESAKLMQIIGPRQRKHHQNPRFVTA